MFQLYVYPVRREAKDRKNTKVNRRKNNLPRDHLTSSFVRFLNPLIVDCMPAQRFVDTHCTCSRSLSTKAYSIGPLPKWLAELTSLIPRNFAGNPSESSIYLACLEIKKSRCRANLYTRLFYAVITVIYSIWQHLKLTNYFLMARCLIAWLNST
jgi:hypothetical protein